MNTIGKKSSFAMEYCINNDSGDTELAMYVKGSNILAFICDGKEATTCWNIDEIALWLRKFIDDMEDDPYPVNINGEYAADKDKNAREFDSEDIEEFDAYYDKLDEWYLRHRWHTASEGGVLADVYFQKIGNLVEISWNNEDLDEDVHFVNTIGGDKVDKDEFVTVVDAFLKEYAKQRFSNISE